MSEACCAICCNPINLGTSSTASCKGHHFHYDCLSSAVSADSRCPVCRVDLAQVGFTYRGELIYPDRERLVVQQNDDFFRGADTDDQQQALDIVMTEGFEEEDAALALIRCNDDPQQAIALLVAEEAEDRTDSEDEMIAAEHCGDCGVILSSGARGQNGKTYCSSCWSHWAKSHDEEILALALDMSLVDAREASHPTHHVQMHRCSASGLSNALRQSSDASSSSRVLSERRWRRTPVSVADRRPKQQEHEHDDIDLPAEIETRQRRWGHSR